MQSITVLIVGQVRNQHVFLRSIDNLAPLRAQGLVDQVILATWTEEWRKIEDLAPRLAAAGVTVTTVAEPDPKWSTPGNLMYQMRGVDLALERVEDTAWVLRARPDLVIDEGLVASLAAADMSLAPSAAGGAFKHKIWTPMIEVCQPMCLSDIAYFGHYADIARLQNFDLFHDVAWNYPLLGPGAKPFISYDPEVRRFTPAFSHAYPILAEYYRIFNHFLLGLHEFRRSMLYTLYKQELYWQYMAAYFDILSRYVLIGQDVVDTPVLLARPQGFDHARDVGCLELTQCEYFGQALPPSPDPVETVERFSQAPVYCSRSGEVRAVAAHLNGIGADLDRRLASALSYRKDAARIAALDGLRGALIATIRGGREAGRPEAPAWRRPFGVRFLDFA